jgi:3-oxoacyl-[acyl-carrier protein] reductase
MTGAKELAGRVAIVTGAGRNIGRAVALALAEAGAAVAVNGRADRAAVDQVVGEIAARGGSAVAVMADVTDEAAVARMAQETAQRLGRIDILVNNAARRPECAFEAMSLADWRSVLATILDGSFLCVKAALAHLQRSGAGAVVNIGGLSAHLGSRNRAHVVTAKAGLIGFTRALAHDLAQHAITVNCVVPGLIDTARDPAAPLPYHHRTSRTLTGRLGTPEEVAAAVRFLAGPDARYLTGQALHVNGGLYMG